MVNNAGGKLVSEGRNFDFANADFAAGIMLLICEVASFVRQGKVHVLVEFVAIDGDFDPRHLAAAPDVVADFKLVLKPSVGLYVLLIDMAKSVQRTGSNRVSMSAVNLRLVAIGEAGFGSRAKV